MNTYQLNTIEDALTILEYFNYFHDGFIKRIIITSRDEFETDKSQTCTGIFDIEIDFAHYNYGQGIPLYNQKIKAKFQKVTDICFDLREVTVDWVINRVDIIERKRTDYWRKTEDCLAVRLMRSKLSEGNEWELVEAEIFTFSEAIIIEE